MLKALILDDEINCIEIISLMLQKNHKNQVEVIAKCTTIEEALEAMEEFEPDIVFLDVEMPLGSGFDFLIKVKNHNFNLIFVTAHESYAMKAIKFNAIDYLLKPVNPLELKIAIDKILAKTKNQTNLSSVQNLLDNLKNIKNDTKKIAIVGIKQTTFVEIKEIIRCEHKLPYTIVHITDGKPQYSTKPLKDFDDMLNDYNFMRANPSDLINLAHVKAYINGNGGFAVMSDGSKIEISRRRKVEFISRTSEI